MTQYYGASGSLNILNAHDAIQHATNDLINNHNVGEMKLSEC